MSYSMCYHIIIIIKVFLYISTLFRLVWIKDNFNLAWIKAMISIIMKLYYHIKFTFNYVLHITHILFYVCIYMFSLD